MPERRIRGHQEAGQVDPARIRATNSSYSVIRNATSKCWIDRDRNSSGGQPGESLVRIAQERRRGPDEDLVRMRVERDHRGPGRPGLGGLSEPA